MSIIIVHFANDYVGVCVGDSSPVDNKCFLISTYSQWQYNRQATCRDICNPCSLALCPGYIAVWKGIRPVLLGIRENLIVVNCGLYYNVLGTLQIDTLDRKKPV